MKNFYSLILCCAVCIAATKSLAQVSGCTDPQANNYNASATVNNGSCTYNVTNLALTDKTALSTPLIDETSGVEFLSNKLWTFNDSGNPNAIYRVDTASNTVYQTVTISNATNTDWEDMTSNNDYLFIGDFGNNNGNRQNLKIYRINKNNLPVGATTATAEVINFSFSDQTSFPSLPNNNNFDCESMIFYNDSIHLFSKNWVDLQTRHYVLPNVPGTHVAQYRETLNAGYLVTGASVQKGGVIALVGYNNSGSGPIYVYMLYDHKNSFFFSGNKRKFNMGDKATYGQMEGVDFFNAAYAYVSNEKYTSGSTIFPRLRTFNLAPYLPNAFVYPKPKSQFVANTTSVCANASITFTDQSENDPTTWLWSFPGGTPSSSTSQNPVVQYAVAGTYNVTLVASNATGNDTLIKTSYVTVNAKPTPSITGATTFCLGVTSTLNAGIGYSSYLWSTGATTQTITVSTSGVFSVTVTNSNGCSGTTSVTTTVNSLPTVTANNVSGCAGSSIVLGGTPAGGTWSVANPYSGPSTTYTHTYTDGNGCTNTSAAANITVNPNPTPTISGALTFCGNTSTTLDAGAGYASYLWNTTEATQTISVSNSNTYSVTVTNGNGCTGSTSVTTNALGTPVPTIIGALSFCAGGSTVLTEVSGWQSYLWSTGATTPSITVTTAGTFSVVVTDVNGCTGIEFVTTTIKPLPTATTSPSGTVNTCNTSQLLTAGNGVGYSYQWRLAGSNIGGATNQSYNAISSGNYDVVVTESSCSSTSAGIILTLGTGAAADITGPTSFCAGSAITLIANTGAGITYQWYKNSVAQSGATSSTYLIGSAGTYYVVETSTCGTATSNSLVVTQINNPNPTMSYTTPTTFCSPGTITFTANTFAGVTYQWQKNSNNIVGATNQTYTATTNGKYRVKETANGCTKQGQDVQITTATSVSAVIAANGPTSFCTGGSVVLSETNNIPGYSYQWKNNGTNISGATLSSYIATTSGSYTCYVSASCGNATSNAIVVSTGGIVALVNPTGTVNVCNGANVAMSANTGTGYVYQWKLNGTNISGATNANYTTTAAGNYTVAITSPCGNATSVTTTVVITALTATASPLSTTICNGSAVTFTANTGYNYTYQWYRAGIAIAGATSSTHANSTAGNYTVAITQGGVCSATSNIAALTVTSNPNPTVTLSGPTTFCAGQSVTITANTFAGITYQWIKGSTNIAGATNQSYTATTAGQYNVKETASGCTKQMGVPVVVTVNCREAENESAAGSIRLAVIPNPFTSEFEVRGLKLEVGDRIEMVEVLGKIVYNETITKASPLGRLVGLSSFPSGIYFLQVITSTEKKTIKVVKK